MTELPEGFEKILSALRQDEGLRKWFEGLSLETPEFRAREFRATATRLKERGDSSDLQHSLMLLALPNVYEQILLELDAAH